jgi:hypothetical protein
MKFKLTHYYPVESLESRVETQQESS